MSSVAPFAPRTVAILCQYGILGVTPGLGSYTSRVIEEIGRSDADLIIIAGGGTVDGRDQNEAESVQELIRSYASGRRVWLETESTTTWGNLWHSIEMLESIGFVPPRIVVYCDRRRRSKVRLAIRLLLRKRPELRETTFEQVTTNRRRVGWRDRGLVQLIAGSVQIMREARRT